MMMASSTAKICFNPSCKATRSERWRQGWRLRTGEYVELCDRCGAAFEDETFCDMFHSEGAGWRTCESCGKRLHCGCIASIQVYVLLDAGGVDCMGCARKKAFSPIWSSSLVMPSSERPRDASSFINWPAANGPNAVSGQWHQRPTLWSTAAVPSELHPRIGSEVNGEKLVSREPSSSSSLDKKKFDDPSERVNPGDLKLSKMDRPANQNTGADTISVFQYFPREEGNIDGLRSSSRLSRANIPTDTRKGAISETAFNSSASCANVSLQSSTPKDDSSTCANFCLAVPYSSNETNVPYRASSAQAQRQTPPSPLLKQSNANLHNGVDSSSKTQTRNGRPRCDARGRNSQELLHRYWPKITDQELQQISGDSNSIITPLFEKTLSASDAGRIGRLVLPKKCAEAYFPTISQPEGLPLKVQDASGKEWVFQFRFWPNNNSRMYVLEGVTPCIQSMQLMAGDTVTFSRLDPEGKLVMGFRKASLSVDQEMQAFKHGNGASKNVDNRKSKPNEAASAHPRSLKAECFSYSSINQGNMADAATIWANVDKSGYIAKDIHGSKSSILLGKRKSSTLGSKSKRLRMDNEELIELKLTWEEAQGLLRAPHNSLPTVVVIEGHEFEEFEEAPILGKPTIFTTNNAGEKIQWAQCEDCNKWRKIPVDIFLSSRWTCSDSPWNPKRSSCSSAGDSLTMEQLGDLLSSSNADTSRNIKGAKKDIDSLEVSESLDALANLAIQEDGEAPPPSAPPTTRHPRHRPGCTCIVCIQPPSGKGPKHKDTCTCNVCLTVRRRFRTLMERREKRQSEKEAENARKKQQNLQPPEKQENENEDDLNIKVNKSCGKRKANENVDDDDSSKKVAPSPFIGGIDLNIQPEREDEPSPVSDSFSMPRFEQGSEDMHHRQLMIASADGHIEVVVKTEPIADGGDGADGENLDPSAPLAEDHLDADIDHPVILLPASASATV